MIVSKVLRNRGFTLVELLVVIAIIGILIGMLLPAVQQVREAARRSACSNNIRQLALGSLNYESSFQEFPSGYTQERIKGTYQGHSVFYFILPFIEQNNLYNSMDPAVPTNNTASSREIGLAGTSIPSFICPSDLISNEADEYAKGSGFEYYGGTSYRANGGARPVYATRATNDGVFMATGPNARKANGAEEGINVNIGAVYDGLSNTVMFGEFAHEDPNFDSFPVDWNSKSKIAGWSRWYPTFGDVGLANIMGGAYAPINYRIPWPHEAPGAPTSRSAWYEYQDQRLGSFGSNHSGGANLAFGDGSVRFLTDGLAQNILRLQCIRDDGQVISSQ